MKQQDTVNGQGATGETGNRFVSDADESLAMRMISRSASCDTCPWGGYRTVSDWLPAQYERATSRYGQLGLDPLHTTGIVKPLRIWTLPVGSVEIAEGTDWPTIAAF